MISRHPSIDIIYQIAESIHSSIQVTVECPSFNEDHKLPLLDPKVWLQNILEVDMNLHLEDHRSALV